MADPARPPAEVLAGFGCADEPRLLPGGQGRTWRSGDVVLKPVDDPDEHGWVCAAWEAWPRNTGIRVPVPLRAPDGGWQLAGWSAHAWLPGASLSAADDPRLLREAWLRFHEVTRSMARPAHLDRRNDAWAVGDRVAWESEEPQGSAEVVALLRRGLAALAPVREPDQVVHGDLAGNVLWSDADGLAVIDWPPYFRPAGWALAVVAMDAVCWEGAPERLLDDWADGPGWGQLLLRAVLYRVATRGCNEERGGTRPGSDGYLSRRGRSLDLVLARL